MFKHAFNAVHNSLIDPRIRNHIGIPNPNSRAFSSLDSKDEIKKII